MLPDLRRIQQFVTVADAGSFTRAAAELHLSQQALSSAIKALEADLGSPLFHREGRRIRLTPGGHALLDEARPLLAAATGIADRVAAAATESQTWTVGHTPALSGMEAYALLEPVIAAFPTLSISLYQLYPDRLANEILNGTIDFGLRRGVSPTGPLAGAVIGYHRVRVAVPSGHRLAAASSVDITDLAHERLTLWAPAGSSFFSDFLMSACRRAGFEPDYTVSRVQGAAMVAAPLTTGGVALVTSDAGPTMGGRVMVVDLEPALLAPVQALWQRHTTSAVRDAVLSAIV